MIDSLPTDLCGLSVDEVTDARCERDERMSSLFRRWPDLSEHEISELRRLNDERQRLAQHFRAQRELETSQPPGTDQHRLALVSRSAEGSGIAARPIRRTPLSLVTAVAGDPDPLATR